MLVKNIGQSSIVIVVNDVDNQPMFVIEDKRNAGGLANNFIETDNAINFTWFNKLVENWVSTFVVYLDMSTSEISGKSV